MHLEESTIQYIFVLFHMNLWIMLTLLRKWSVDDVCGRSPHVIWKQKCHYHNTEHYPSVPRLVVVHSNIQLWEKRCPATSISPSCHPFIW